MTCYTILHSLDKNEFEKKVAKFVAEANPPLKIKEGSQEWLSDDVYRVVLEGYEDSPMSFCVETGGAIWFKSFYDCTSSDDLMREFLHNYLTGFYAMVDFFSPNATTKYEWISEWAEANGINNYGAFVPTEAQVDDLLDNFEITNYGELRTKIYELGILGYSEAFSDEFYSDLWYMSTWELGEQDPAFDVWVHCDCAKLLETF
jgi:hypothetical protein